MKLADHAENIRQLIDKAFRNKFGRLGINLNGITIGLSDTQNLEYDKVVGILEVFREETGNNEDAYEKLVEEFTFTLFNRLAALKVMETHTLHPEILTRRSQHGDRSFAHYLWLEQNPAGRNEELEGLISFMENQFTALGTDIPLFNLDYPYHLLPTAIELNGIINAFNQVDTDSQVEPDIWKSDDVLGWLYESYNNKKKADHKDSGAKTEYNKVSIQSQVYTPRWVVKFLVDNSLGKLYLEMYPDSDIKRRYKIANAPNQQCRERRPLTEIKMIDPANGSGNFLLYSFDLYFDLYLDQIENYGTEYREKEIPELIIRHNLHGIDLDDRAVQLTQLGLYIKAKRKRASIKIDHFNVVSSDFFLPEYQQVRHLFENGEPLQPELEKIVIDLWSDLQQAHKFGSLIRLDEKFEARLSELSGIYAGAHTLFADETKAEYDQFRQNFLTNLLTAVAHNAEQQGVTFVNSKTQDAITFLTLLTQKYSVAVANPPYTQSAEYGEELKFFISENFRSPINTYENLYSCFIQRNFELLVNEGFIAMITPQTYMFIDSFKELRNNILHKTHIELLIQYGFSGIFKESIDPSFFVLTKGISKSDSIFVKLDNIFNESKNKIFQDIVESSFSAELFPGIVYYADQKKLELIKAFPFIYWISDNLRKKFRDGTINDYIKTCQGLATGDNCRFLRYHWEVSSEMINKKWFLYAKGGTFNKWAGNLWLTVDWENNGNAIKNFVDENGKLRSRPQNESFYFSEGITYSASGRGGYAFRYLPSGCLFDVGGSSLFLVKEFKNVFYVLGLLNSKLAFYIADCLNPTANIQVGDIQRVPFIPPSHDIESLVSSLAKENYEIKQHINSFNLIDLDFKESPLSYFHSQTLRDRLFSYFDLLNTQSTILLINEAIINENILNVYELSKDDTTQVYTKMGNCVGQLPVTKEAKELFIQELEIKDDKVLAFINKLKVEFFDDKHEQSIKRELQSLYQADNDLEGFCDQYNNDKPKYPSTNPINVWYWFKESKILPLARSVEITIEFLAVSIKTILIEDNDGIVPLNGLPGEPKLLDRLEQLCLNQGFTSAQFMQLDGLLGRPLNEYIEHSFFNDFSNHLNLFMYLPKTPFIWHLSSGEHQGFEAYTIIYKWNRDSLFKLKTQYLSKRKENLEYRLIELEGSISAQAQDEKEMIRLQIQEINEFTDKVDELISEGYDPKLDDGVGKNIAPLQKKGMLRAEVLNKKQLEKYLNADW